MIVRLADEGDEQCISELISKFRIELKKFKGIVVKPNLQQSKEEFEEYIDSKFPVFVAEDDDGNLLGYLVCRINGLVVWAESLYVTDRARRKGIATRLYKEAERIAMELGNTTVFNWVHPNNDAMIAFLARMGYNVLNLIEIRRPKEKEELREKIRVGNHEYCY